MNTAAIFAGRRDGLELASRFAEILATTGIEHGLIGPRERDRIWDRHVLNCAVLAEFLPSGVRVVDVGSGAGLPGIALVCARDDLCVDLVEPLERRTRFLTAVVAELDLGDQVRIIRGRADEPAVVSSVGDATYVTARALAPLDRLVRWCLPLLKPEGQLLAIKGRSAQEDIDQHHSSMLATGASDIQLLTCGASTLDSPVTVVRVRRGPKEVDTR